MSSDRSSLPESLVVHPPSSAESTATNSSLLDVEPLHHPQEMAHVEVPHNVENIPQGASLMTGKALLAKKMAANGSSFYSPSDALVSPCTQKLSSQKGKRWANAKVKPAVFGKSNLNQSSLSSGADASLGGSIAQTSLHPSSVHNQPDDKAALDAPPASKSEPAVEAVTVSI